MPDDVTGAVAALEGAESVSRLLTAACEQLRQLYDAQRTTISRTIGDLLVELTHVDAHEMNAALELFLITDYPLTGEVVERNEPRTVLVGAPGADPAEVALMQRLGFRALLMLPLRSRGQNWGIVEVLREQAFTDADAAAGAAVAKAVGEQLERLEGIH